MLARGDEGRMVSGSGQRRSRRDGPEEDTELRIEKEEGRKIKGRRGED